MNEPDETYDVDHDIDGQPSEYGKTFGRYAKPRSAGHNFARGIPIKKPSAETAKAEQFMRGLGSSTMAAFEVVGALLYALWPRSGGARRR